VPLSAIAMGRVESAAAVLLPSLALAAQRRLRPWMLLLCLGHRDGLRRVRRRRPAPVPRVGATGIRALKASCRACSVFGLGGPTSFPTER
jgi:hypothetical protein